MKNKFKIIIIIIIISLTLGIKDINAQEIPKVYFEGNIKKMVSKADEREIKLKYVSKDLNFESYIKIKVQGSSSLAYDKKNYTIKLYKDKDYENKMKVDMGEGWGEQYKFCLKANWVDKTHARNIVTARITSDIQNKYNLFMDSPNNGLIDGFPVEIYSNNEFLGIYTWNIPKDAWMFNMDDENPNHIVLSGESYYNSNKFLEETNLNEWEVEAGPETDETLKKINKLINFIKDSTDKEFKENFEKHMNLDATLNYYVMMNYAKLIDNWAKNMLLVTYDGELWFPSLYDLDTSWGSYWNGLSISDYKEDMIKYYGESLLWTRFKENFPNEIANRYFELRKDILTKENVMKEFKNFYNSIPEETLKKEQKRWKDIPGYNLKQIEEFIDTRTPLTDEKIYKLYNINPEIKTNYSTKKTTIKPITVELIPNRTDIKILKDGKIINNDTLKFTKNGTYTYEYQDWYGNKLGTITIEINNIKTNEFIIAITTIIAGIILFIFFKKKKDTIKKIDSKKTKKENNNQLDSKKTENKKEINKKTETKKVDTKKNTTTKKESNKNQKNSTKKVSTTNKKVDTKKDSPKKTSNKKKSNTKKDINPKN